MAAPLWEVCTPESAHLVVNNVHQDICSDGPNTYCGCLLELFQYWFHWCTSLHSCTDVCQNL